MGKTDVLFILKKNNGQFFSAADISKFVGLNVQTTYAVLKKLHNSGDVDFKEFIPPQGPVRRLYGYTNRDDTFEFTLQQFQCMKKEERFGFMSSEVLSNLMVVKELKELNEAIKNGRNTNS